MTRAEEVATRRWVARHVTTAAFGTARPHGQQQGPAATTGVLAGLLVAAAVWAAPLVVDLVRDASGPGQSVRQVPADPQDAERRPE